MYVKCGDVVKAKDVFDKLKKKDVPCWTSMIVEYPINGQAEEALRLFAALEEENKSCSHKGCFVVPNHVTFIGVLMACSHSGMLQEGKRYFRMMTEVFGIKPRLPHYGCMVDLFCRDVGCYKMHTWYLDLASIARNKLLELDQSLAGDDAVMSNIYAAKGMWA
ncbi:OLC1v1012445C1 [Oldenlandia corymbosa var. corymbosa]|uniref:OLC1v1012445C1 n=1 Tax=Oldenlandia corymbosa var. corymbosa TaxID=529605 RepID=A0AAV1DW51_OLDCO|nr:OLC1v1012445C1 [Oldenlandia corymbosa var. corymbosa]